MNKDIKRLDLNTPDGAQLNMDALYQIAPSVFTESRDEKTGELKRVVNFDALRQLLGDNAVDESRETYEFRWVGKDAAKAEAARPTDKTLRPVVEDSVDWDTTKNLYIEGDNLEVLKLLQRSYMGKVKMIYIDPPYNTGNDFVYHDDFAMSSDEYDEASGAVDDLGNKYIKNTETSGRFHSDWCNMIYPRLMVARSLLTEDGVIFISIDDNEVDNLRKICDEIFGAENLIANFHIQVRYGDKSLAEAKAFKPLMEYVLLYAKSGKSFVPNQPEVAYGIDKFIYSIKELTEGKKVTIGDQNVIVFKKGEWELTKHSEGNIHNLKETWITGSIYTNMSYGKVFQKVVEPRVAIDGLGCLYKVIGRGDDGLGYRYYTGPQKASSTKGKMFSGVPLERAKDIENGVSMKKNPILCFMDLSADFGNIRHEGGIAFNSGKKPLKMLKDFISISTNKDSLILDFFSGSASTGHAVMEKNYEDGGKRRFIMVQLPELINDNSEFDNICKLGEQRLRNASEKYSQIMNLYSNKIDTGFRVLRLDDSNFLPKQSPSDYNQEDLGLYTFNIKPDRTDLDLLFGSILAWGLQLDMPMETEEVDGCKIYTVNDGDLVACFATNVTDKVIEAMAEKSPLRVLFSDSCFATDDKKINIFETFKQKLDWTDDEAYNNIRVI